VKGSSRKGSSGKGGLGKGGLGKSGLGTGGLGKGGVGGLGLLSQTEGVGSVGLWSSDGENMRFGCSR